MKILLVSLSKAPGIIRYNQVIARSLADLVPKHRVTLMCPESTHELYPPDIQLLALGPNGVTKGRSFGANVIHFLSAHPANIPLALFLGAVPRIFTVHDASAHPGEVKSVIIEIYTSLVTRLLADHLVLHGKFSMDILARRGLKPDAMTLVPLSMGDPSPEPAPVGEEPEVLFFGKIRPYKGIDTLVRAAEILFDSLPRARLTIAGEGDLSPYLKGMRRPENFTLINRVIGEDEVSPLVRRSRVVVLPYSSATQSGVIPVAYAEGRPVVVTRVGSLPEMVEDGVTGLVVPPDDPRALAEALKTILSDRDLNRRMGEAGYRKMAREYSSAAMVGKLEELYARVGKTGG